MGFNSSELWEREVSDDHDAMLFWSDYFIGWLPHMEVEVLAERQVLRAILLKVEQKVALTRRVVELRVGLRACRGPEPDMKVIDAPRLFHLLQTPWHELLELFIHYVNFVNLLISNKFAKNPIIIIASESWL